MKRSEHRISFTKTALDTLETKPARYFVYDAKVPGLAIQITPAGTKTFYLYRWLDGKPERIRLGRYPEISPELARKQVSHSMATLPKASTRLPLNKSGYSNGPNDSVWH